MLGHCPVVVGSIGCTLNTASEASLRQVDLKGKREVKYTAFTRHKRSSCRAFLMYLSSIVNEGNYSVSGRRKFLSVGSGQWAVVVAVLLGMEEGSMTPICLL